MTVLSLRRHSKGLGLSPRRRRAAPGDAPPMIVQDGLVAEWRFNDGAGQVLADHSGHGHHGQLGSTTGADAADPTWTAEGLSFDGGDFVHIGSTLPAISGIDIVFKANSIVTPASSPMFLIVNKADSGVALGNVTSILTNEIIAIQQNPADSYAASHRVGWTAVGGSLSNLWHLVQLDRRAATNDWNIVLDGTEVDNAVANAPVPAFLAGTWRMGANGVPTRFFLGRLAYVVLYGTARTNEQQAQNRAALTSILTGRGIALP
jgi:hypothetical protein